MRTLIAGCFACCLGISFALAQNRTLLYDFTEIPQSLMVNPGAHVGYQWHAGVPFVSGIGVHAGSSGVTVQDIFADDGLDINDKIRQRAINGMDPSDEFSSTFQVEMLSGGFRGRYRPENYFSFGIYTESDAIGYWLADLAILAWEGNADQLGRKFDLSHLSAQGQMLNVFHFGINREMNDRLTLGARGKIYSGIFDLRSTRNNGYFVTVEGQDNLLANTLDSDMRFQSSGLEGLRRKLEGEGVDEAAEIRNHILSRGFFGGDLGIGVDLGFTYELSERLFLTGSLLDLGFMVHHSDVRNFSLQGRATSEGVQIILPDALEDPDQDFWQDFIDEIEALLPFEEDGKTYLAFRPTKLYASIRYNTGGRERPTEPCDCDYRTGGPPDIQSYKNAFGGQLFMINRPRGPQAALTAFYQRRIGNALAMKATYTVDKFSATKLGLGMNLQAGPVEFYLLADNLFAYRNLADAHYASLLFGLNILSWGRN
jgi:hypothetical protein